MIIFHLITSIDKGGAETHLYHLIKKQVESENTVFVIFLKGNGYWKKYLNKIGVKVYRMSFERRYNFFNFLRVFFGLQKLIIKHKPKIVHAHLTTMELFGALLKYTLRNKFSFVVTKHLDSFFLEASFGRKKFFRGIFIDKFIINRCDKVICISNQVKKYFKEKIPYSQKYKVIYYGFSIKDFKSSPNINKTLKNIKLKYKINQKDIIFSNIARHVKQKSLDVLIKAYSIYAKRKKNSKLILVGKGPETNNLKKLAVQLNINKNICWINNYEKIKDIFILSDVFVLTSEYEGLGLVLLESMSSKTAIIASNTSAIPELIKNNFNGFLFSKGNYQELADKFKLIENFKIRKKFEKNGFNFLIKNFNLDKMNSSTTKIYHSL